MMIAFYFGEKSIKTLKGKESKSEAETTTQTAGDTVNNEVVEEIHLIFDEEIKDIFLKEVRNKNVKLQKKNAL